MRQGGLYFDMEGRPVFVEMKPAAFYGAFCQCPIQIETPFLHHECLPAIATPSHSPLTAHHIFHGSGDSLMRPYIKLDEQNKPVRDRPFQPKLPNEPLIGELQLVLLVKGDVIFLHSSFQEAPHLIWGG